MVRTISKIMGLSANFLVKTGVLAVSVCLISFHAHAQFATDACDPDYYESLKSRAWLEAQREITQNQNLIFKADSVLEYTCFDQYLGELAAEETNLFSGNPAYGTPPGDMTASLTALVGAAMDGYDTSNFNHNLLGGRLTAWPSGAPSAFGGATNPNLPASVTAGSYACDLMEAVWMVAKCMDFNIDPATDGFFTFAEYAAAPDRRRLPTACTQPTTPYTTETNTAVVDANTPWDEDIILTYFNLLYPTTGCGPVAGAGAPSSQVATGLFVTRDTVPPGGVPGVLNYHEKVCVVPGCFFKPDANSTVTANPSSQSGRCCPYTNPGC